MNETKTTSYEAPMVTVIEVHVEQGFAASDGMFGNSINGWDDGGDYSESIF